MPQASVFTPQRLALYGGASVAAAAGVVMRAFRERSNFYAATVFLARSNGCMLVLLNFGVFMALMFGKACQAIFFGSLRPIEVEHLYEKSWYAVTETLLAMTIFRDEFDGSFIVLFGTLLFLKVFHWLCADRVELMEQSPSVSRLFHARMVSVLWTLFCLDLFLVAFAVEILVMDKQRPGIMIMFASEFMILFATLLSTVAKYLINVQDMRSEEPWEGKSMYVSAVDLVLDLLKLVTYTCFFAIILTYHGLPLNIVRDVYVTARSFFGRIRDFIRYRAATRNMDTRFPNATHEDLRRTDGTCIICRDEMHASGPDPAAVDATGDFGEFPEGPDPSEPPPGGLNETPKKLACGHIFHFHCLRAWLERQQSCPTCRRTVFDSTPAGTTPVTAAAAAAAAAAVPGQEVPQPGAVPQQPAGPQPTPAPAATNGAGTQHQDQQIEAARQRLQGLLDQVLGVATGRATTPAGAPNPPPQGQTSHGTSLAGPATSPGTSSWVPPPPSSLAVPRLDLPPEDADTSAEFPNSIAGPSSPLPSPSASNIEREAPPADDSDDPIDPRAAARSAALRRFQNEQAIRSRQSRILSAASASGEPLPRVLRSSISGPSAIVAGESSEEESSLPLHLRYSALPSSTRTPLAQNTALLESGHQPRAPADLDEPLDAAELSLLTQRTRRGVQAQLDVLQRAQVSIFNLSTELMRVMSALPDDQEEVVQQPAEDEIQPLRETIKEKGKAVVINVEDEEPQEEEAEQEDSTETTTEDKGKRPAEGIHADRIPLEGTE